MEPTTRKAIAIEWRSGRPRGHIRVADGKLLSVKVSRGDGSVESGFQFAASEDPPFRIDVSLEGTVNRYGEGPTIISIVAEDHSFSFFLRDVNPHFPILIPEFGVLVTTSEDTRTFREVEGAMLKRGFRTRLQQIEAEPEETFESAAENARRMTCPTWLGLSRDMRIFAFGERLDWVQPRFHYFDTALPENDHKPFRYEFVIGRGWGVQDRIERHLEGGVLPILRGTLIDGDIAYDLTAFVTLETSPLTATALRGTHFLVADGHAKGHMFTPEQERLYTSLLQGEMDTGEETVLFIRICASNTFSAPRYAFFRNIWPGEGAASNWSFDNSTGFGLYVSGRVFSISKLNGAPLAHEEVAILLQPGEKADLEIYLPHRPISHDRAEKLSGAEFQRRYEECVAYWKTKLDSGARIELPEKRISEMVRAGLLHLDIVTYGREPEGALAATIGDYCPIGSESSPIIQFMDSMGWHKIARRALTYFLEKQHDDGLIQNFGAYMLETGAALWSMGEHYRYTRDEEWVKQIAPKLIKSCEFILRWRQRNQRDDLGGRGYGMLEGKVADPEDPYHSFMLNGYAYLGLSRVAEMFERTNPPEAAKWRAEADGLKADIRQAFFDALGASPVVPLGDGRWCPTCPPWTGYRGPLTLHADGGAWFTHGTLLTRDSMLGPLYLVYQEVLEANEQATTFMLDFHCELMTERNVVFSQPYYSRHPVIHLRRGETKPFLKAYYNTVAGLADRETYTFWEHFFHASAHKTHEEAWFLMDTRWMLYSERGQTLQLLIGVPRKYLENGKCIEVDKVASYFGPLSFRVLSKVDQGQIEAMVECTSDLLPHRVEFRLPHPAGLKATDAKGGTYNPETERVAIEPFKGCAEIRLRFQKV